MVQLKQMGQELIQQRYQAPGRLLAHSIGKLASFRVACPEVVLLPRRLLRCFGDMPTEMCIGSRRKWGTVSSFNGMISQPDR